MDMGDGKICSSSNELSHHIKSSKHHVHSYRELPIRIAEIGMMHRYEKSQIALTGLQHVREMSLNDGLLFVTPEQIKKNSTCPSVDIDVYEDFNLTEYRFRLSSWPSRYSQVLTATMRCGEE